MILEELKDILWKKENGNIWQYDLDKLINYIEILSKECTGKLELTKKLGVYEYFIDKLIKKHNRVINLNFILKPNNARFKAIYQDYNWCYQKYMMEGMSHDQMAIEANCSKRVIEKWCNERHQLNQKYRQINKKLNKLQCDMLVGNMLGDGHIDRREEQPIFIVCHAENQKDYLYYKYYILKDLCNMPPVEKPEVERYFNSNHKVSLCQKHYRFCTRVHDCLKYYRSLNYSGLLNLINEYSFCIWMLDDGYRDSSNWRLCVAEYTNEDVNLAINLFKQKWEIKAWREKDDRYLIFDAISTRKIDKIILNIIPNDFDIIQYKLLNNPRISTPQKRITINMDGNDIYLSQYCKENNLDYKRIINRTYSGVNIYDSISKEVSV